MDTITERFCMYCEMRPSFLGKHYQLFNQIETELNTFGLQFQKQTGLSFEGSTDERDRRAFHSDSVIENVSLDDNIKQINEQLVLLKTLYEGDGLTCEIQQKCLDYIRQLQDPFQNLVERNRDRQLRTILLKYEDQCRVALGQTKAEFTMETVHQLFD